MTEADEGSAQQQRLRPWLAVGVGVFCIGWGGNQFTPLLIAYRQHCGYSRVDVDVLLGAYVIGLVPGLLLASALSDRYGRRRLMTVGLVGSALGSAALATGRAWGFSALFGGRDRDGRRLGVDR